MLIYNFMVEKLLKSDNYKNIKNIQNKSNKHINMSSMKTTYEIRL